MNLNAAVDEAMNAAVDLIEITSHETELLQFMRPKDIVPLMERKQAIANYYNDILKKLKRRRVSFSSLDDDRKREIAEVSDWVQLVVGENARLLSAAHDANEKLLLAIREAATEHYGSGLRTYTRSGNVTEAPKMARPVTVSLGLNEMS